MISPNTEIFTVVERYPNGTTIHLHKTLKGAIATFKKLVVDNLPPDEVIDKKEVDKAATNKYWSTCEGDYDQEVVITLDTNSLK